MSTLLMSSIISWVVAGVAALITWRTVSEAKRQSALRVATLAADLQVVDREPIQLVDESPRLSATLFEPPPVESDRRGRTALVAGALVVGTVLSLVIGLSALGRSANSAANTAPAPNPVAAEPIDLIALGHERTANTVTVRGVVRNPMSGHEIDHLAAVVMLYNSEGSQVAAGQAQIAKTALTPGAESAFSVTLPDQATLGRYRVSFKTDERVISHVDRRATNQSR